MSTARRAKYTNAQKELVRDKYPLCRTLEDKEALAAELGIESIHKLYNLASRLRATRTYDEWAVGSGDTSDDMPDRYDATDDLDRLRLRETPADTTFTAEDDRYLKRSFGRQTIEQISFHRGHTETAMLYRARHLGLRRPVRYWDTTKVEAWLNIEPAEWEDIEKEGVDRFPLRNRRQEVVMILVSTTSLFRWLVQGNRWQRLVAHAGADEFFVREIIETVPEIQAGETEWESCRFLSAGHVCMCPYALNSFGLFCSNNERHAAGEDPKCTVRGLRIGDVGSE